MEKPLKETPWLGEAIEISSLLFLAVESWAQRNWEAGSEEPGTPSVTPPQGSGEQLLIVLRNLEFDSDCLRSDPCPLTSCLSSFVCTVGPTAALKA
jgi:hypothetical protein